MTRSALRKTLTAAAMLAPLLAPQGASAGETADKSQKVERTGQCQLLQLKELHVEMVDGRPMIPSVINGQKVMMLADTGTANTMLLRAAADRLGIKHGVMTLEDPVMLPELIGIGNPEDVHSTTVDLDIDSIAVKNAPILVVGTADTLGRPDVAGAVGASMFWSLDVEFDLPHGAIRMFLTRDCKAEQMVYWGGPFSDAAMRTSDDAYYEFKLDATLNGKDVTAILASGSPISLVTAPAAQRVRARTDKSVKPIELGGRFTRIPLKSWTGAFDSFTVGNEKIVGGLRLQIADPYYEESRTLTGTRLLRRPAGTPEMLLGADFFRAHRVMIANSQGRVYFSPTGSRVFETVGTGE